MTNTPIGNFARDDRELIALADLITTAVVRIELFASKPEANERLLAYFDRYAGYGDEIWRDHLLSLIKSCREESANV